ncbi:patatin-like phospholipase [Pseudoduganella flava]|uniref:Patatin family protein n=1 Tax=Pseudoduganella flava TaxID=871742 RepID=A0A562Q148_9BURK|nr:patatin-like phospholipase family protein [Pseudoduganella flava]QGZ38099.1 patatin family protein [Pseudoduganella flava]TWI50387.1 patatin-like phospholipase [Pseudoduganella flava]
MATDTPAMRALLATLKPMLEAKAPWPASVGGVTALLAQLKAEHEFGLGAALLKGALACGQYPEHTPALLREQAMCTYKNEHLPPAERFDTALGLLRELGLDKEDQRNTETLCLAAAIHKRRFEFAGQPPDLLMACHYYAAAWQRDPEQDRGYGGVNAAFVLDQLAARLDDPARREHAAALRHAVIARLEPLAEHSAPDYWLYCTLAEAHWGLGNDTAAAGWLARAAATGPAEWQLRSTTEQLVKLARLHGTPLPPRDVPPGQWPPVWKPLHRLLGQRAAGALGAYRGKVGLALSGGGMRAAFYHVGVLARLAELDLLRHVEVISCVSGGSIVGALYYLELKKLLEARRDDMVGRQDYIDLVDTVRKQFLARTAANLRMRVFCSLAGNVRMLFQWPMGKHRTARLGALYERYLYRPEGGKAAALPMRELLIKPSGETADFSPAFDNWRRAAKVPALLLNATSLNTGHAWHFTAKGMGEPPALVSEHADRRRRYRRLYYTDAPTPQLRDVGLGAAVAASSGVPVLFAPLELAGLYQKRVLRLVDGGVFDNQGVRSLQVEGCTFMLCSDACGQMEEQTRPCSLWFMVYSRSTKIMMERGRETTYQHFAALQDHHAVDGFLAVHLKKDLTRDELAWIGCPDMPPALAQSGNLPYGIAPDMQRHLAAVRTDLDAFSEVEANALMLSGYLMTEHAFKTELRNSAGTLGLDVDTARCPWDFLRLEQLMASAADPANPARERLATILARGKSMFSKAVFLAPFRSLLIAAGGVALGFLAWRGALALAGWLERGGAPAWVTTLLWAAIAAGAAVLGFTLFINAHLYLLDPVYLKHGRMDEMLDRQPPDAAVTDGGGRQPA